MHRDRRWELSGILIILLTGVLPGLAQTEATVPFVPKGANAQNPVYLQTRDQMSGYAYPDFCATVDGSTDNTTCLGYALAATGVSFGVLELPPVNSSGTSTVTNYVCTSLGLTWPNATARVHIWKGATVSCAFPPADATHIIQDDNLAPIIPWTGATFPSTDGGAVSTCTSGCSTHSHDMTASGTYTGTVPGSYCVEVKTAAGCPTADVVQWGFNAASSEQINLMDCSSLGSASIPASPTAISLGNGISVVFADQCGHNVAAPGPPPTGDSWSVAVTPRGANPGYIRSVSVPATADVLCAQGSDTSISGVDFCLNSTDATSAVAFHTLAAMPANLWSNGRVLRVTAQFALWTTTTPSPPSIAGFSLRAGTTALASAAGLIGLSAGLSDIGASASWLIAGTTLASGTPPIGYYTTQPLYNGLPGATLSTSANLTAQPVNVGTAAFSLGVTIHFTGGAGGNPAFSHCSGACSAPTSSTCTATATNGTGSGAVGTIPGSGGSFSGQQITITTAGSGYDAPPTNWTVSGTSCSGTIVTTGGTVVGAPGNAIQLQSLLVEQVN